MAAYWDAKKEEVVLHESVDISIAVATEKVICQYYYSRVKSLSSIQSHYSGYIASGFDDSDNEECRPKDYISHLPRGILLVILVIYCQTFTFSVLRISLVLLPVFLLPHSGLKTLAKMHSR